MTTERELFRFCACCPSPCRSAIPAEGARQTECVTPSSLALMALAVIDGQLSFDPATRASLQRTTEAHRCVAACPYGYDIATAIDDFVARRG